MAFRLGEYVVGGEIFNTTNYSVHGWVELRGREQPLVLQLTGNCSPDLAGWHFRFEARPDSAVAVDDSHELDLLAIQQIGPTGTMTAAQRPRGAGPVSLEPVAHDKPEQTGSGEPGKWLFLEWHSQNGHVLIELVDPILELIEYQPLHGGPAAAGTPSPQAQDSTPSEAGPKEASTPPAGDDEDAHVDDHVAFDSDDADIEVDDPYNLFPHDLQLQLNLEGAAGDWNAEDDDDKPQMIREMELMDELIENSPGVPVSELFDGPLKCPLPERLGDHEVEAALKTLLAEMALHGVAMDICEHFSPREAYQLLLEKICPEERAYPELRHTQWVQHYSTSDYCQQCQATMEQESGERQDDDGVDPDDADDDIQF